MKHMHKCITVILLALLLAVSRQAWASDARGYLPLPQDTLLLVFYYDQSWGEDIYSNGDKVGTEADLKSDVTLIRPIYYTEMFGVLADLQFILPVGKVEMMDDQSSGLGDLILASTFWVINNEEDNYFLAYTPYVTLPTGEYDRGKVVNMGANRYSTKQELCFGLGSGDGLWWEVAGNVEFFTDNDDADSPGGRVTLEKAAAYGAETHLSYDLAKGFFASLDYYYQYGGETTLDGVKQDDEASTHTIGVSGAYMITPTTQFLVNVNRDISVRNGVNTTNVTANLAFAF
jgi:hypothetical protein